MSLKINKDTLTIGSDPELFLVDQDGKAVSAIDKIPGSKNEPFELPELGKGFAIQTDCCCVEFNVPPVNNSIDFYKNIETMFGYIRSIIPQGVDITTATSMQFDDKDLEHPQAKEGGCSADYNAWELKVNSKPKLAKTNWRCAGAHLHFGYEGFNDETSIELIKALDLTLGVTSIVIDQDIQRRKLYGRAGCFRMTHFGVEYRTPSPYYLASQELVDHVFKAIDMAVDIVNSGKEYSDIEQLDIQTCINIADVNMAYELIKKYSLEEILPVGILVA